MVHGTHPSHPPKRHLDRFIRFCRADERDQQKDRQTDQATPSARSNRPHLAIAAMRPKNWSAEKMRSKYYVRKEVEEATGRESTVIRIEIKYSKRFMSNLSAFLCQQYIYLSFRGKQLNRPRIRLINYYRTRQVVPMSVSYDRVCYKTRNHIRPMDWVLSGRLDRHGGSVITGGECVRQRAWKTHSRVHKCRTAINRGDWSLRPPRRAHLSSAIWTRARLTFSYTDGWRLETFTTQHWFWFIASF